jgi:hypothetical protein
MSDEAQKMVLAMAGVMEAVAEDIERMARPVAEAVAAHDERVRAEAVSVAERRVSLAREALIGTGYFTPDQVGDDIAPRITELWSASRPTMNTRAAEQRRLVELYGFCWTCGAPRDVEVTREEDEREICMHMVCTANRAHTE